MAIANYLAVERWIAQAHGEGVHRSMEGGTIFALGDAIYSYGTHSTSGQQPLPCRQKLAAASQRDLA